MFDIPTETKLQRKAASRFREFLLDQGFERSQFSVYARFVNGKEGFEAHVKRIERNLPDWRYSSASIYRQTIRKHASLRLSRKAKGKKKP